MVETNKGINKGDHAHTNQQKNESSIGNQQNTAQTGGQNAGGENRDEAEDQYTDDLRRSGDRNSSNTKDQS